MLKNYIVVLTTHILNSKYQKKDKIFIDNIPLLKLYGFKPSITIRGLDFYYSDLKVLEKDARAYILINSEYFLSLIKILSNKGIPFHAFSSEKDEHIFYSRNQSHFYLIQNNGFYLEKRLDNISNIDFIPPKYIPIREYLKREDQYEA